MRYICFDFETVGFCDRTAKWPNYTMPWENHPIQLSIDIVDESGVISHACDTIIAGATGFAPWVHANVPVTLEQVATEGRPFREVLQVFADLIQDGDTLVARNIEFDINRVIGKSSQKMGIDTPALRRILAAPRFCTMRSSYSTGALGKQPKLSKLCEHFGVVLSDAHDARADTFALAECVAEALRRGVMLTPREEPVQNMIQTTLVFPSAPEPDTTTERPKKIRKKAQAEAKPLEGRPVEGPVAEGSVEGPLVEGPVEGPVIERPVKRQRKKATTKAKQPAPTTNDTTQKPKQNPSVRRNI